MDLKLLSILLLSACLAACGGGSSSGGNESSVDDQGTGDQGTGDQSSLTTLTDTSWSAGSDRILGIGYSGSATTPMITTLKGTPVDAQDGDLFSFRSVTYPATELAEIKSIDNLNDIADFQDLAVMDGYVIACQDGASVTGYEKAASLHIFKATDTSKTEKIDIEVGGDFQTRACASISAAFTQGTSDAMAAKVFMVGLTYIDLGGGSYQTRDTLTEIQLTFDTTKDVDATDAIVVDSIERKFTADFNDALHGVTHWAHKLYFFQYDDSEGTNILKYLNTAPASSTPVVVHETANDAFASNTAQSMFVKDMFMIPGTLSTDSDTIYMVSDSGAPGVVTAAYRTDIGTSRSMALSTNTNTQNCSDVITGVANNGVGAKMWCYDSTDAGKIIEIASPVAQ
tara:strand:- start:867 stop:2060 length:1194 start_codon:yes stop_codon:yes gene_type:complete